MDWCSAHSSFKKLFFRADGNHYRKPQLYTMQRSEDNSGAQSHGYKYNMIHAPKAWETLQ